MHIQYICTFNNINLQGQPVEFLCWKTKMLFQSTAKDHYRSDRCQIRDDQRQTVAPCQLLCVATQVAPQAPPTERFIQKV